MPTFAYSGRTRGGQTVSGEHVADTADAAVAALRRDQILVTRIDPSRAQVEVKVKAPKGHSVPSKSLAIFTRQFSVMIDAGLPLAHVTALGAASVAVGGLLSAAVLAPGDPRGTVSSTATT